MKERANTRSGRASTAGATGLVLAFLVAGCGGEDEAPPRSVEADTEAIRRVGTCFANGIDLIGAENVDAGIAVWDTCFTTEHTFEFTGQIPGADSTMTITCPGPRCPAPPPQSGSTARATFANAVFRNNGYVATQHVLNNVVVDVNGDTGTLTADLIAFHFKDDSSIDVFNGRWSTDVVHIEGSWRSSHERASQAHFVNVAGAPLGEPSAVHERAVRMLGRCYTDGIDLIGAGDAVGAKAVWSTCSTPNLSFDFDFGSAGSGSCPGDRCPAPPPGQGSDSRADFAAGVFAEFGYRSTQHLLSNIGVAVDMAASTATLTADLTAFHHRRDGSIDLFSGSLQLNTVRTAGSWLIDHESVTFTSFLRLAAEQVPSPF